MHGDPALLARLDPAERDQIQWLLDCETEYLDRGRYRDWLALYAEDCLYWMPAAPGQTDAREQVSLFHEGRALMAMRIERLTAGEAHSLEREVRVSHVVGPAILAGVDADGGTIEITRRFHASEHQGERRREFAGLFRYTLAAARGTWRIRCKRVDLVDCDAAFEPLEVFL